MDGGGRNQVMGNVAHLLEIWSPRVETGEWINAESIVKPLMSLKS